MFKVEEYNNKHMKEVLNIEFKDEDLNEMVKVSGNNNVKDIIGEIIEFYSDYIYVIIYDNKVSGIFGVIPDQDDVGLGILLTDNNIRKYKRQLIVNSTIVVDYFLETYSVIYNYCPASYTKSLNWLVKICGAVIEDKEYIINGEVFKRFLITKK